MNLSTVSSLSSLVPEKEEKNDGNIDRRDGGDRKDIHGGVSLDFQSLVLLVMSRSTLPYRLPRPGTPLPTCCILQVNEPPHNCLFTACLTGRTALLLIWTLTALLLRDENERDSSEEIILKNVCPLEFKVVSLENSNSSEEFLIQRDWMTYFCAPLIVHLYECALVPARTKGSSIITHARWAKSSPAVIHARCETTHTRAMLHGRMYSKNIRVDEEFATVVHLGVWVFFSTSPIPYEQNLRASSALRVAAWRGHYNETGSKQRRLENIANMSDRAISFYGLS